MSLPRRSAKREGGLWVAAVALMMMAAVRASDADAMHGRPPEAPRLLSQTGLYAAGTLNVDPRNRSYSPQYPLWTDGAVKRRWVRLPEGAAIDARDDEQWEFPVGTKFWKEFAFNGRRVETRFIWRARPDAWVFATYLWNEAQSEATLAPSAGVRNASATDSGSQHSIPSIDDCHACHEKGNILGFTALQLSTDRDPLAPHAEVLAPEMVTVKTLVQERLLRPARQDLISGPPRIMAETPVARAAIGYLSSNCGICHRTGAAIDTHLRLRPSAGGDARGVLDVLKSAPVSWEIQAVPEGHTRFVKPGHPELSSIMARMRSRRPSTQMPPLGTAAVDREASELIAEWIREMK